MPALKLPTDIKHIVFEDAAVRKHGQSFRLRREVEAMEFVRKKTSLPIPVVLATQFELDGTFENTWYLMEKMPGIQLGTAWPNLNQHAKDNTIAQLKDYLEQLRSIKPQQPAWIGSCSGGPAYDHRIDNLTTCGPFQSVADFHDFLVGPIVRCPFPEQAPKYRALLPDAASVCFAHADLSWENIMVDPETGHVTAILDWEMAGFWPEWWEYRKALYGSRCELWWVQILEKIMQPYNSETESDMDIEMF